MTQTALPPRTTTTQTASSRWDRPGALRPAISIHGEDPTTGIPATWHVTRADDDAPGGYVIERADGDIRNPHVWMQARREARVGNESDVIELIRSVMVGR